MKQHYLSLRNSILSILFLGIGALALIQTFSADTIDAERYFERHSWTSRRHKAAVDKKIESRSGALTAVAARRDGAGDEKVLATFSGDFERESKTPKSARAALDGGARAARLTLFDARRDLGFADSRPLADKRSFPSSWAKGKKDSRSAAAGLNFGVAKNARADLDAGEFLSPADARLAVNN